MVYIGIHTGFFRVFRAFSPQVPPAGEKREVRKSLVLLGLQPFFRQRNSPRFPHACTRFVPLLLQFFGIFCCILSFFGKKENPRNPCNCWGFGDFPMAGAEGLEPSARGFGAAVWKEKPLKIRRVKALAASRNHFWCYIDAIHFLTSEELKICTGVNKE